MSKLPMITALFWIMKILATTLGETGGDLVAQTLNVGYFGSSLLFITLLPSVSLQLRVKKFYQTLTSRRQTRELVPAGGDLAR